MDETNNISSDELTNNSTKTILRKNNSGLSGRSIAAIVIVLVLVIAIATISVILLKKKSIKNNNLKDLTNSTISDLVAPGKAQ